MTQTNQIPPLQSTQMLPKYGIRIGCTPTRATSMFSNRVYCRTRNDTKIVFSKKLKICENKLHLEQITANS